MDPFQEASVSCVQNSNSEQNRLDSKIDYFGGFTLKKERTTHRLRRIQPNYRTGLQLPKSYNVEALSLITQWVCSNYGGRTHRINVMFL